MTQKQVGDADFVDEVELGPAELGPASREWIETLVRGEFAKLTAALLAALHAPAAAPVRDTGGARNNAPSDSLIAGAVFGNFGRSKGRPVAGASASDLAYYKAAAERSLADQSKSRWHDKERALLAAIEAEIAKQGGKPSTPQQDSRPEPPPDEEIPF